MGSLMSEILNDMSDGKERRAMYTMFNKLLNNDTNTTYKAINIGQAGTTRTGLDTAAALQHGTYTTALAYGAVTENIILKSMHASAAPVAVAVMGDVNYLETSADSTGYMYSGYDYLSIGYDLVNGYASRSRVEITDTCEVGETVAVLGTLAVTAGKTITGGTAVIASGLLDLNIAAGAAVAQEATCLEIRPRIAANVVGSTSGIRINVNCSTANYLDYGLDIRSMSTNQTAAIRILATPDTSALACGIHIEGQDSSTSTVTNAINLVGTITNVLDFAETDGSQASCTVGTYNSGYDETPIACFKVDMNGTAGYVYIHDTVIGVA